MTEELLANLLAYLFIGLAIATPIMMLVFLGFRGRTYLLFLQQEEYDHARFLRWWWYARAFDKRATVIFCVAIAFFLIFPFVANQVGWVYSPHEPTALLSSIVITLMLLIGGVTWGIIVSRLSLLHAKKSLVMTARAKRIMSVYVVLCVSVLLLAYLSLFHEDSDLPDVVFVAWLLPLLQLPPFVLVLANLLLSPYERSVQAKFRREAEEKLARLKPTVIGIAGSYGKTSTKHILAHILGAAAPTLATPGSVNTVMGVTRIIRENLEERHKYFIVEMGAYGPGSIAKLCRLAPPAHGIVTSIGKAHLERFGDIETVFRAKFELADAVLGQGGCAAVNADQVPADLLADYVRAHPAGLVIVGLVDGAALKMTDVSLTAEGLRIAIEWKGESEVLSVPLYGRQQAGNVAVAVALALSVGLPMATIKAALANVGQIRHRLEVTKSKTGPIVIDDVYNSNPAGFRAGLELLDMLNREGGRRVVITPGMVELGSDHGSEHLALGEEAARRADLVLLVTPERVPTFAEGFRAAAPQTAELKEFPTQQEAEGWYKAHAQPLDTVLFENNLPDLYEAKVRF